MLIAPNKPQPSVAHLSTDGVDFGTDEVTRRPRVVIIGGGFAGLAAAHALAGAAADVVLIDRRNYHVFQPLLYQVATAALSPADIASPIRGILSRQGNATVLLGEVSGIDRAARLVRVGEREVPYDYLVVATGARHSYVGHSGWEQTAPGLKTVEDAVAIRSRILLALEQAEATDDEAERRRLMTFVVVGAGPTGVELAGVIAELVHATLASDFRRIDPTMARIVLVEASIRVLPTFAKVLSSIARRSLQGLGVELRLGVPVSQCDAEGIVLAGKRLPSAIVLWAGGVAGSPAAVWLGAAKDQSGRVIVTRELALPGDPDIFVIGDTAHVEQDGRPLPGVAPVAKQQGAYVGRVIAARIAGKRGPDSFRYRGMGSVATIGSNSAVAQFGALRFSGRLAWLLWGAAHIYFLIGFRNRLAVMLGWMWAYATVQRGARLITGQSLPAGAEAQPSLRSRVSLLATRPGREPQPTPAAERPEDALVLA